MLGRSPLWYVNPYHKTTAENRMARNALLLPCVSMPGRCTYDAGMRRHGRRRRVRPLTHHHKLNFFLIDCHHIHKRSSSARDCTTQ